MELIPTKHKGRLPKGLSHPLGAELLSRSLSGVPQRSDLGLHFNAIPSHGLGWATPGQGLHTLRGNAGRSLLRFREVLYCGYWPPGFWSIGTFPVPSADRSRARTILVDLALPRLAEWLGADRPPTWQIPQRVLQFGIREDWCELGILETQNDRILSVEKVKVDETKTPPPDRR